MLSVSATGRAASFDCSKASGYVEKTICSEVELSGLDDQLWQAYKDALAKVSNQAAFKTAQRRWLTDVRNNCQDSDCLRRAYADRIMSLNGAASTRPVGSDGVPTSIKATMERSPIIAIPATPRTVPDRGGKLVPGIELNGKIEFAHNAAGGSYVIISGRKTYTIGYVWEIDESMQVQLEKVAEAGTMVTVKGTLRVWNDGSARFDNAAAIEIFR
jgi:uncharacterized protein YecT (DUF1311 family)